MIAGLLPALLRIELIPLDSVIDRFPLIEYFEQLLESNDTLIAITNTTIYKDALEHVVQEVSYNYG